MAKADPLSYQESTEMLEQADAQAALPQVVPPQDDSLSEEEAMLQMQAEAANFKRPIPQSKINPNITTEAGHAGNQMRLAANMGEAIGNIARGIAGGDESSDVGGQFYQNAITASYAPQSMAEDLQKFEAQTLAVTAARHELEEKDPTSEINRRYQKSIQPFLEKAGMGHLVAFVTIADMSPGGIYNAMRAAQDRADESSRTSMLRLLMQDKELAAADSRNNASIAARKKKGGGGSGGGRGVGALPEGYSSYSEFENDFREKWSQYEAAITSKDKETVAELGPWVTGMAPYLNPKSALGTQYYKLSGRTTGEISKGGVAGMGEGQYAQRAAVYNNDKLLKDVARYAKSIETAGPLKAQTQKLLDLVNKMPDSKAFVAAMLSDAPPIVLSKTIGKEAASMIQTYRDLISRHLKEISGTAVSEPESQRVSALMGLRKGADKNSMLTGLRNMMEYLDSISDIKKRSVHPDVAHYMSLGSEAERSSYLNTRTGVGTPGSGGGGGSSQDGFFVKMNGKKIRVRNVGSAEEALEAAQAKDPNATLWEGN